MASRTRDFTVEVIRDVTVVRLATDMIDRLNLDEVLQGLRKLVLAEQPRKLLLNLDRVEYFHSIALGRLVVLSKVLEDQGGEMRVCNLRPTTYQVFVTTQLDRFFRTYASERAALEDWAGAPAR